MGSSYTPGGSTDLHSPGPIGDVTPSTVDATFLGVRSNVTGDTRLFQFTNAANTIEYFFYGADASQNPFVSIGTKDKFSIRSGGAFGAAVIDFSKTGAITLNGETTISSAAPGTLALRDGTNPQTMQVYNTYIDASNYEVAEVTWNQVANRFTFATRAAGSGADRDFELQAGATGAQIYLQTSGQIDFYKRGDVPPRWSILPGGDFVGGPNAGIGLSSILIGGVRYYPHDTGGVLSFTTTP